MDGKKCEIACGECCEQYWWEVFDFDKHPGYSCPHLGPEGCKLPRPDRPRDCLLFLCRESEMTGYIEVRG